MCEAVRMDDKWRYFDITHSRHVVCNPLSVQKFQRLCHLLRLRRGARVLDIAFGKGEFLITLAELYDITGVGVDLSPYCIRDCVEKHRTRVPSADLEFVEMDGAAYTPAEPVALAACIGASWVYGGHRGTIAALTKMVRRGGLVVVGEPFWLHGPSEEYLREGGMEREDFGSHRDNVQVGEAAGLTCLYTIVSDHDDWDHYETLQWWAVDAYVRAHPDDPDVPELVERTQHLKEIYLRWGRDTLGWAIYVFRKGSR
jgi:SAM-dependent methyltransferase